jgi:hypothetical protein
MQEYKLGVSHRSSSSARTAFSSHGLDSLLEACRFSPLR